MRPTYLSALQRISTASGQPRLDMATITDWREFPGFAELRRTVLDDLRFPEPTADKTHGWGWTPTLFMPGERVFADSARRDGHWRRGEFEADTLSCYIADVDNADPDLPPVAPAEVVDRLEAAFGPLNLFTYTSHSDRPHRRKFRVVVETSRDISRGETRALFALLDAVAFGRQGDASIHDPGDFLFAPPFNTEAIERDGAPFDLDAILAEVPDREVDPDLWRKFAPRAPYREARAATPEEAARLRAAMRCHAVREGFRGIEDPAVFNPAWASLYPTTFVNGSHWETMRSVMAKVWRKTGGTLSRGEMEEVFDQVDATGSMYFARNYDGAKRREVLDWVMRLPALDHPGAPRAGAWAAAREKLRGLTA